MQVADGRLLPELVHMMRGTNQWLFKRSIAQQILKRHMIGSWRKEDSYCTACVPTYCKVKRRQAIAGNS